jgi:hypothetical protein
VVTSPKELENQVRLFNAGPTDKDPACGASFQVPSIWADTPKIGNAKRSNSFFIVK